jgi:O-acetylhomoserine/O-acetylserine sulfhydrylase-like pyridoxal-dependent enzyme
MSRMRFETLAVHGGHAPDRASGAVAQPITLSGTCLSNSLIVEAVSFIGVPQPGPSPAAYTVNFTLSAGRDTQHRP